MSCGRFLASSLGSGQRRAVFLLAWQCLGSLQGSLSYLLSSSKFLSAYISQSGVCCSRSVAEAIPSKKTSRKWEPGTRFLNELHFPTTERWLASEEGTLVVGGTLPPNSSCHWLRPTQEGARRRQGFGSSWVAAEVNLSIVAKLKPTLVCEKGGKKDNEEEKSID